MRSNRLLTLLLLIAVAPGGCVSNRIKGPIYAADGPPWVAGDRSIQIEPIDLEYRVLLIGDAGYFLENDPTLAALGRWSAEAPLSSVVFLGDNIYNKGLVDDDRERGEKILAQQLASSATQKIFIPGNHDWGFSPKGQNREAILNQQSFVDAWPDGSGDFIPRDGCMGPMKRLLHDAGPGSRDVVLIATDPTPWINPRLRDACPEPETHESYLARLEDELANHSDDFVLVVSHYPLRTGGPHGGLTYGFLADIIIGIIGWSWGGLMNTYEPNYADWIDEVQTVFRKHPPLAYVAGHDHSLQLLDAEDFARIEIVSGAGSAKRVTTVTNIQPTLFAHAAAGFVVLDFGRRDGEPVVVTRVIEATSPNPVFEMDVP